MRFLLDENVELQIGRFLGALGHDVSAIALDYDRSVPDSEVLRIAVAEGRTLITNDLDFGELVFKTSLLEVVREPPRHTASGQIQHLQQARRASTGTEVASQA